MVEAVVEYEYTAQEEDELTIKVGEIIKNVTKEDGGWWRGQLNGKEGMFPDNFVKEIRAEEPSPRSPRQANRGGHGAGGNVAALAGRLGKDVKMGPAPNILRRGDGGGEGMAKKMMRAKVTYSYSPANQDELPLNTGDIVDVLKQDEEGWWYGSVDGKTGMFPSNFVEVVEDASISGEPEKPDKLEGGDGQGEISGKKIRGVGLGNIFSDGPIKLRAVPRGSPATNASENKKKAPSVPSQPPVLPPREVKAVERAQAIYSYIAENEDELSLQEGDIIIVLEKELQDSGWWKGEFKGKVGVFPDNFVKLLPPELPEAPEKPPPPVPSAVSKGKPERQAAERPPPPEPVKQAATKHKEDKETKPSRPASIPPKPAPPVHEKKPRTADPKLIAQTDDHKAREQRPLPDPVPPPMTGEKQVANKGKTPHRRAPSIHPKQEQVDHEDAATNERLVVQPPLPTRTTAEVSSSKKPVPLPPPPPPPPDVIDVAEPPRDKEKAARPPPPKKEAQSPPTTPSPTQQPAPAIQDNASAVDEIRNEIEQLRGAMVSREDYDSLHQELQQTRRDMDHMKQAFNKRLMSLMNEVDDEKKLRLTMEVEVKRIKDLVTNT